ncbi:MAG: phosphoribosyltransferase family protein [Arenibacter algicola]|nr:phosphoribosyltransferase family protein [Arenibacter algicola]
MKQNKFLNNIDYVVPVPLHQKKLKKRGYNQVSLFAKSIAEHIGAQYLEGVLIKTANTRTQTKKSRILRWQNKQALYVLTDQDIFRDKNVLLLDDVITTGATMEACATALSATKGINIYVGSMAIVP